VINLLGDIMLGVIAQVLGMIGDARAFGRGQHRLAALAGRKGPSVNWLRDPDKEKAFDIGIKIAQEIADGTVANAADLCTEYSNAGKLTGQLKETPCSPCKEGYTGVPTDFNLPALTDQSGNLKP